MLLLRAIRWAVFIGRDPESCQECPKAIPDGTAKKTPEMRAECSLDTALHHVDAPEQKGYGAGAIDQRQDGVYFRPPGQGSR
jgi:hypothetical protein